MTAEQHKTGIYVANHASIPERSAMWRAYRAAGAPIISTWIDEAGPGKSLMHDLWKRVADETRRCATLVLYVEPDDLPLKGALVEVGLAQAQGAWIFVAAPGVAIPALGSWVWLPRVTLCGDADDAMHMACALVRALEKSDAR